MRMIALRGATTVEANEAEAILHATEELMGEMLVRNRLEITIHEGRKRQVRRMLDAVGHPVLTLERVRFGPLWLGKLEVGEHRRLTRAEVERLRRAPGNPRDSADDPTPR